MRTPQEIYDYAMGNDFFGFALQAVIEFLPYRVIKTSLEPGVDAEKWDADVTPLAKESVLKRMQDYAKDFGWDKIQNHRGISANRTITKMSAWAFCLGHDVEALLDGVDYPRTGPRNWLASARCSTCPSPRRGTSSA